MVDGAPVRNLNPVRRFGYRLLPGDSFSYVLHMRPAEWPIMAAHTLLGYVLAVGVDGALWGVSRGNAALGLFIWVVLLNGGTLAINSVFDRDEGDIGYLRAPPKPPRYLLEFSISLFVLGGLLSFRLPIGFGVTYLVCVVLSWVYSVPPFRFKAVAGVDWVINMVGFGTLTPFALYAATGRPLEPAPALVMLAFCPLFAALYPLTQLYQFEEDSRRGDRTLALIVGMKNSLLISLGAAIIAHGLFVAAWLKRDPGFGYSWDPAAVGPLGIMASLAAWLSVVLPWLRRHGRMTPHEHQNGMYRALAAWALTDVVVVVAFAV